MLKKPLISIIILNYNAGDLILNCINSVVQTKYENYEIILVDNISTDNSHKKCKEKFKQIQLIENSKNYGYCLLKHYPLVLFHNFHILFLQLNLYNLKLNLLHYNLK